MPSQIHEGKEWLRASEAMKLLGISKTAFTRRVQAKKLQRYVSGKTHFYSRVEVEGLREVDTRRKHFAVDAADRLQAALARLDSYEQRLQQLETLLGVHAQYKPPSREDWDDVVKMMTRISSICAEGVPVPPNLLSTWTTTLLITDATYLISLNRDFNIASPWSEMLKCNTKIATSKPEHIEEPLLFEGYIRFDLARRCFDKAVAATLQLDSRRIDMLPPESLMVEAGGILELVLRRNAV